MKEVCFVGDSRDAIKGFSDAARQQAGYQLHKLQHGDQPDSFKPMPTIGHGVEEIRIRESDGAYRVIYTARLADAIYVLHAFQKKTQKTNKNDIEIARKRLKQLAAIVGKQL